MKPVGLRASLRPTHPGAWATSSFPCQEAKPRGHRWTAGAAVSSPGSSPCLSLGRCSTSWRGARAWSGTVPPSVPRSEDPPSAPSTTAFLCSLPSPSLLSLPPSGPPHGPCQAHCPRPPHQHKVHAPWRSPWPPPPPTFLSFSHSASAKVSVTHRFADHLHKFHENDNGAAAGDLWQ